MPKMNIVRREHINAPIDKVYNTLHSMKSWQDWSPWLISDPDAVVNVAADDQSYEWEGSRVGSGNMKILKADPNRSIDYDLNFLKPWKSNAKVKFEVSEKDGGTEVAWHMDSQLPWFMFWMKKQMEAFVGNDYKRGLMMLKDQMEHGHVQSKLDWKGESQFPGCQFIGIRRDCTIAEMPSIMEKDFTKLMEFGYQSEDAQPEAAFSQYHKFDFVKQTCSFTSALPMKKMPEKMPEGTFAGKLPATKINTLQHTGRYDHLGNAWTTMYTMQRNKEFKMRKGIDPFETYGNSQKNTAPEELISYINFAVK